VSHTPTDLEFLRRLPKAELHLHLEGSVSPRTLSELSAKYSTPLETTNAKYRNVEDSARFLSEDDVRALYHYQDFTGFLLAFKAVTERLRTAEDYEFITYRLCQHLAEQGVRHAEIYVSVGVIFFRGQDFDPLFQGLDRGRHRAEQDFGITLYWIFDAVRQFGAEAAMQVVEKAIALRAHNVVGFGIGGDERRAGPELFTDVYAHAAANGLRLTCHAGETTGPDTICATLDLLKAERLGHALSLASDDELLARCVREQVPLEICLSSNVRTGCCPQLEEHPVRKYFDAGAVVTLNTDDPEMFETSLLREYQLAQDVFGFTRDELRQLAANSIRASFLPADRKRELLAELAAV
jgi:adenosine deaminase/aminodeoxyfutalosine deaminase